MLSIDVPTTQIYNPKAKRPLTKGNACKKRADFYQWLDTMYPERDIAIYRKDFKNFLLAPFGRKGAFFITIHARTKPDMKANFVGEVEKWRWANVVSNFRYKNMVNNARRREFQKQFVVENDELVFIGDGEKPPIYQGEVAHFTPKKRKWGKKMKGTPYVTHKGKYYLEVAIRRIIRTRYFLDGFEVNANVVEPHIVDQDEFSVADHQGLPVNNRIIIRDYSFENIHAAKFCKRIWYVIEDE